MKKFKIIILYIITLPLFITWLFFCLSIGLIGFFLSKKNLKIDLDAVKKTDTICSVLNSKGLLSDEEYSFETNDVASFYDEATFSGYLFVLNPIIYLLKTTNFADSFVLFVVNKWMLIHHYEIKHKNKPNTFFSNLAKSCIAIAGYIGQVSYRFKS